MNKTYYTVPMKFSVCALLDMLLSSSDIMTLWQVLDDLLTNPTTIQQTRLGVREAPFEVWHDTIVGGLTTQIIWIRDINLLVCSTWSY
jgi:hypothetical protein